MLPPSMPDDCVSLTGGTCWAAYCNTAALDHNTTTHILVQMLKFTFNDMAHDGPQGVQGFNGRLSDCATSMFSSQHQHDNIYEVLLVKDIQESSMICQAVAVKSLETKTAAVHT